MQKTIVLRRRQTLLSQNRKFLSINIKQSASLYFRWAYGCFNFYRKPFLLLEKRYALNYLMDKHIETGIQLCAEGKSKVVLLLTSTKRDPFVILNIKAWKKILSLKQSIQEYFASPKMFKATAVHIGVRFTLEFLELYGKKMIKFSQCGQHVTIGEETAKLMFNLERCISGYVQKLEKAILKIDGII